MKDIIFYGLILSLFFVCSCKGKDCNDGTDYPVLADGCPEGFKGIATYSSGKINDTISGEVVYVEYKKTFSFDQYGGLDCVSKKSIALVNIPTVIGDTAFLEPVILGTLKELTEAAYFITDDDAVLATYRTLPSEAFSSWVLPEDIDEEGVISGQFQLGFLVMKIDRPNTQILGLPDTLIFTNGVFEAKDLRE